MMSLKSYMNHPDMDSAIIDGKEGSAFANFQCVSNRQEQILKLKSFTMIIRKHPKILLVSRLLFSMYCETSVFTFVTFSAIYGFHYGKINRFSLGTISI